MDAPPEPRDAATVILVRPAARDATRYEVFMVRRPATSAFAPDAYVFPGGTLRPDDWPPPDAPVDLPPEAAHARLAGPAGAGLRDPRGSLAIWIAALRELFEEAGVLLAYDASGQLVAFDTPTTAERFTAHRAALTAGAISLWDVAAREGLTLAPGRLRYWAHWITPEAARRRYDTRFFVARLPPRQEALHCALETTEGLWLTPDAVLARHAARAFPLVFATRAHIERLATLPTLEALWAHTANKAVVTVLPRLVPDTTPPRVIIPAEVRECW